MNRDNFILHACLKGSDPYLGSEIHSDSYDFVCNIEITYLVVIALTDW